MFTFPDVFFLFFRDAFFFLVGLWSLGSEKGARREAAGKAGRRNGEGKGRRCRRTRRQAAEARPEAAVKEGGGRRQGGSRGQCCDVQQGCYCVVGVKIVL